MSAQHVVMDGNAFVCRHCGEVYRPTLPATILMFAGMAKVFVDQHKACRPPGPKP